MRSRSLNGWSSGRGLHSSPGPSVGGNPPPEEPGNGRAGPGGPLSEICRPISENTAFLTSNSEVRGRLRGGTAKFGAPVRRNMSSAAASGRQLWSVGRPWPGKLSVKISCPPHSSRQASPVKFSILRAPRASRNRKFVRPTVLLFSPRRPAGRSRRHLGRFCFPHPGQLAVTRRRDPQERLAVTRHHAPGEA